MRKAYTVQKFQDWFTQQVTIFRSRKIEPKELPWLMGPFGNIESIGDEFVYTLAEKENLVVSRNVTTSGLINNFKDVNLSTEAYELLSHQIINFYEKTPNFNLNFKVQWNPIFKLFGKLLNILFSNRINQLNVPISNKSSKINSEIITLTDPKTQTIKYTVWYRTFVDTGKVLYSGIYTTCTIPSGETCVKAIFPLPKGNATVIMSPKVGTDSSLSLDASGKQFGDPGFYFLLNDANDNFWSQYIRSFRDKLVIWPEGEKLLAEQTLTLWHLKVLRFYYEILQK